MESVFCSIMAVIHTDSASGNKPCGKSQIKRHLIANLFVKTKKVPFIKKINRNDSLKIQILNR